MKKLCIVILILLIPITARENALVVNTNLPVKVIKTSFLKAFDRVNKFEGYYVNHPLDRGGETYRGIARRFNKEWLGWDKIDAYQGRIRWNQQLPEADFLVLDYYLTIWVREGFDQIKNHTLAAYVFEFRIHGNSAVGVMKREINNICKCVTVNNIMDAEFITALNSVNSYTYIKKLKIARKNYYLGIVKRKPNQKIFLKHWLTRIDT